MTLYVVPTTDAPSYAQQSTFEGTTYNLFFQFNTRCQCWYMSLADASGSDIYNGVKVIVGQSLLRKCKDQRAPPGAFYCFSSTSDDSPPGQEDLIANSGRCTLFYMTSDWLDLLESAGGTDSTTVPLGGTVSVTVGSPDIIFSQPQSLAQGQAISFATAPGFTFAMYAQVTGTAGVLTLPGSGGPNSPPVPVDFPPTASLPNGTGTTSATIPGGAPGPTLAEVMALITAEIEGGGSPEATYGSGS